MSYFSDLDLRIRTAGFNPRHLYMCNKPKCKGTISITGFNGIKGQGVCRTCNQTSWVNLVRINN